MLMNTSDFDLIKAITRTEAKKVHKDLPEGGAWKTIKGHHVYIVNGKIVAGSIPGVTKAKKMTKATMAEHQATVDAEGKKKSGDKKPSKTTGKATNNAGKKSGSNTKGAGGAKKKTDSGSGKKGGAVDEVPSKPKKAVSGKKSGATSRPASSKPAPAKPATKTTKPGAKKAKVTEPKGKANGKTTKVGAKTDEKPSTKPTAKSSTTGRTVSTTGAKKGATKPAADVPAKADTQAGGRLDPSKGTWTTNNATDKIEVTLDKNHPNYKETMEHLRDELGYKHNSSKGVWTKQNNRKQALALSAILGKPQQKESGLDKVRAAKAADIRTDAQKNRELAYDVGDKVGGARKDDYEASFKANANAQSLEDLEKMSGAVAEKMVTKANLLPKYDYQQAKDRGEDLATALLKKLIQDRIAPKPEPSNPETRKAYLNAINKVQRHFGGIKDYSQMRDALRELSNMARKVQNGKDAEKNLKRYEENPGRFSYFNNEHHHRRLAEGQEAEKVMGFNVDALGDKFNNLLTNWDSTDRTLTTVAKNAKKGWDEYTTAKSKVAPKEKGAENKKWVRKAEAEHLRTGGKATSVSKPEDLMKEFGLRGVEFGHWVNDSSGLYHLKRSAEALDDLADVIGIDKNDISLNGRLALAFGARGKGTALAHYEPDRKVINMTKHGGAGSLAHEWGHAMDNIMHQYSNGGQESLALASEGGMGSTDPKLNMLYDHLMSTIMEPQDGVGHVKKVDVDSEANRMSSYYPSMRRVLMDSPNEEGVNKAKAWSYDFIRKATEKIETMKELVKRADNDYSRKHRTKELKKMESQLKGFKRDFPHMIAADMAFASKSPYKGTIEVPTGTTEYYNRMKEEDGDKGKEYYAQPAEMFARVFESYVQDKLDKAKRYNNYLVHGTREGNVKVEGAPFPMGKERETMFKAMDNLMQYISSKGTLKKAILFEILASGSGDLTEELRKSLGYTKRDAYNVENPDEVIYIPINRLKTPYQTEEALNWDKVDENVLRMVRGENLEPVEIGYDYDVHDGHHRLEASSIRGYAHVPCKVKGGNDIERQRAIEAYKEVWKSIMPDPTSGALVPGVMYRGVGLNELNAIHKTGFIQSKGKGNDDDKTTETCFSNLWSQAEGYARSNYDLYNEKYAFVLTVRKEDVTEDEHGELIARRPIPKENIVQVTFIGRNPL